MTSPGGGAGAEPTPARMPEASWPEPVDWHNRYDVGVTEHHPGPESMEIKHMLNLVAYDVCEPKRLRKVAKVCEDFGARVEKSVFECDLPDELFQRLWLRLIEIIDEGEDAIIAYRICKSCVKQVESMGVVARPIKRICYIL